jgi:hypothetical protein
MLEAARMFILRHSLSSLFGTEDNHERRQIVPPDWLPLDLGYDSELC